MREEAGKKKEGGVGERWGEREKEGRKKKGNLFLCLTRARDRDKKPNKPGFFLVFFLFFFFLFFQGADLSQSSPLSLSLFQPYENYKNCFARAIVHSRD